MVYANADITKTEQAAEIIAFAGYWNTATGSDPGLLVFDSQLTTYKILGELTGRGISWLTLRQRGKNELARPGRPPGISMEDRHHRPDRAVPQALPARGHGQAHRPQSARVCQIAVKNTGRDEPTPLITNDLVTPARDLFARYAERMTVENELDAYIGGFHLDALTSGLPLNVDLDTTLTVLACNLYRLLALKLPRYENATPDKIWRHFLDATGTLHITSNAVTCAEPAQPPPRTHRRRLRRPRAAAVSTPRPTGLVGAGLGAVERQNRLPGAAQELGVREARSSSPSGCPADRPGNRTRPRR
jgi:hypothetical protein